MRRYDAHRHAYSPRLWPMMLASCSLSFFVMWGLITVFGTRGMIPGVLFAVALGIATPTVRWRLWRRRHPMSPCGPHCLLWMTYEMERRAPAQRETARWQ
jgi:hypothetical protein